MAYVPQCVIDNAEDALRWFDMDKLREAENEIKFLEERLARARRHLVEVRNRRAQFARFLRENPVTDDRKE